jgi:hypothetical protein
MEQAVQGGGSHNGIAGEDLVPVSEGFVAGENDGLLFFIAFADGLEEETGVRSLQSEIANFIDDEQFGTSKVFDLAGEAVLG